MCKPASFVATKDRVYWSRFSDEHQRIIGEYNLCEDGSRGPNIVRVEITPPDRDWCADLDDWEFRADQDVLPEWWDADTGERRARAALQEWAAAKLVVSGNHDVMEAQLYAYGSASVVAWNSASVRAYGSASVVAYDSASVEAYGSASVVAQNSASVENVMDHATVRLYDHASAATPEGAYAVVIDCRGGKAVCITENQEEAPDA